MVVLQNFKTFTKPTVRTGIGSEFTGKRYDGHATEFSVAADRDMLMYRSAQAIGEHMTKRVPSQPGDVLILLTEHSFTIYAVGRVSKEGQEDFHSEENVNMRRTATPPWLRRKLLPRPDGGLSFETSIPGIGRRFQADNEAPRGERKSPSPIMNGAIPASPPDVARNWRRPTRLSKPAGSSGIHGGTEVVALDLLSRVF